jgi:hypothetical protein
VERAAESTAKGEPDAGQPPGAAQHQEDEAPRLGSQRGPDAEFAHALLRGVVHHAVHTDRRCGSGSWGGCGSLMCTVAAAPGAAGVRVWQLMSRWRRFAYGATAVEGR